MNFIHFERKSFYDIILSKKISGGNAMNKILVSDYDNTFYLNDEDIERNKKAVQKFRKKGNLFVLATGRSYIDIKSKIDKYNIEYDYLIINHGATIIGENEEVLYNFSIKDSIISDIKLDLELDNIEYLNNKPEKSKDKIYFCCRMLESRLNFENEKLTKIAVKYDDSVDVSRINKKISDKYQDVNSYHVSKNMIEIISKDINKSYSLIHDTN